jgi:hypothetical protein
VRSTPLKKFDATRRAWPCQPERGGVSFALFLVFIYTYYFFDLGLFKLNNQSTL